MSKEEQIRNRWKGIAQELGHGSNMSMRLGDDLWQDVQEILTLLDQERKKVKELDDINTKLCEALNAALDDFNKAEARLSKLVEALNSIPFSEYGIAQREGCDANGAWDCFREACDRHIKQALSEED